MNWNTCRLCKGDISQDLFRFGIRHYCHAECGFKRWGDDFLRKIPAHEIGNLPYRMLESPERIKLAAELCPLIASTLEHEAECQHNAAVLTAAKEGV